MYKEIRLSKIGSLKELSMWFEDKFMFIYETVLTIAMIA